uniref:hypothetical protein n=1 Tax=uncultured Rhizobium sp. TaxID=155567 RepID=UPI002614BEBF|nr:hypothetical protein [uncultured Rhizobium sp.]
MTGQVLHRADIPVMNGQTTLSLHLKRDRGTQSDYVVLAMKSAGNYQYAILEIDEFDKFVEAAQSVRSASKTTKAD